LSGAFRTIQRMSSTASRTRDASEDGGRFQTGSDHATNYR
jgi:hypothetical protein